MKKNRKRDKTKYFTIKEVSYIVIGTVFMGIIIGIIVNQTIKPKITLSKYSTNYEEIIKTYQNIKSNYYKDVNSDVLLESAVKGMIDSLGDQYSEFLDPNASKELDNVLQDEYVGIGCSIKQESNHIVVEEVYQGTPSYGKLKKGDQLIQIDNRKIDPKNLNEVVTLMKGKENTKVKIVVKRKEEYKTYTVNRSKVPNQTVTHQEKDHIGIIQIEAFTEKTTQQFEKAFQELQEKKIKGLIIDLRDNAGGYISSAEEIASIFLKKGQIIYQLEKKGLKRKVKDTTKESKNIKVILLINENTASASEILSSALKEQYGAILVGTKTYGKASVQKIYTLSNGSSYKCTVEKWLTSKGKVVDQKGINPDIIIENNKKETVDKQLLKALEQFK